MRDFCLVLFFCLAAAGRANAEPRPRVFSVLLEPTVSRDGIVEDAYRHRAALGKCGYDVVGIEPGSLEELEHKLRHYAPLGPRETFLVDGHGFVTSDRLMLARTGPDPSHAKPLFRTDDFLSTIARYAPRACVHLDVCHAGAALPLPEKARELGLSMPADHAHQSFSHNPSSELMIDLLCSAHPQQGDCALWRRVDRDGDGTISEGEFQRYLRDASAFTELSDLYWKQMDTDEYEAIRAFRERCERDGGSARLSSSEALVRVRYLDYTDETDETNDTDYHREREISAGEFRRLLSPRLEVPNDWRRSVGVEESYYQQNLAPLNGGRFRNIRFFAVRTRGMYKCQRRDGKLSYQGLGPAAPGYPATIQFVNTVLQSTHCAGGAPPRGSSGRSGLAGIEEAERRGSGLH